ncbi:uncharacterized protein LOC120665795 [Panicum virgatum]|uniref:Uncharacterized protein n=1 Tax=Panicum virgatum TaxID=38727 RepID=A0A8T0UCT9_PANVG|nr:uncharacterized protein LOC120665795 [Panicum virgatum]KAG2619918.1 hypothetical protein PVAP13_3NG143600 [Panicum virgatum]KAG2619920.1 hypothetical protein PVAP13_3NG143600 [Panicum virgatum]
MASSTKSDLVSGSPDGHGYFNPQRGPYAAASLERSGSFREGGDSYTMFSASSSSRSAGVDSVGLLQSLAVDLRAVTVDHKTSRLDLKKSISSIFGTSTEDSTSIPSLGRNLPNSIEEIRRMRSNLNDASNKARERSRAFGGAVTKLDKLCPNIVRKRSRGDGSSNERVLSSGGAIPKNVPQSHLNADDMEVGLQRGEERTKNAGQNRRIRTSIVEMDARTAGPSRGPGPVDRISDPGKATNGSSAVSEEKIRGLATSIDGWEKPKMKKKRSAIKADMSLTGVSRSSDVDRESKQGMQHKFSSDGRARMASSPSFRSGTVASGPNKADLLSAQNGLVGRPLNRSDQDSGFHPTNKRERQVVLDKEMPNPRTINKPNEDDSGGNITSLPKVNGSARGPRSNSGSLLKSSPNTHRLQANSDDWELSSGTNKLISAGGSGNPKRTKSTHSLSPPTQWGGQRPLKISRSARKSNLIPIITTDGALVPGSLDSPVNEDSAGLPRRASVNGLQQTKRGDHGLLTGSEGDEPVVAEKKLRDKSKRAGELDDGHGSGFQKIAILGHPSKRNKLSADEDIGDAARRQGRVGRGFTPTRPGTPVSIDKLENAPTTKQRSVRTVSERNESKSGRPMMKKISDRKGNARPRHTNSSLQSDSPVQSEDDHEELLAAANAALRSAYSSPFWRQVEPFFAFLTTEDVAYLSQQIHLPDDSTSSRSIGHEDQKYKGGLEYISQPSTPAASNKDDHTALPNGFGLNQLDNGITWEASCIEPILDQLVHGIGVQGGSSVGQRLIQALIDEDKVESITNNAYISDEYPFDTHEIHFDDGGWKPHAHNYKLEPLMNFEAPVRAPNGLMMDSDWKYNDGLSHKSSNVMDKAKVWPEFQYSEMCFSDRIIIELSEVGVCIEPVPDLAHSEDEDIDAEICKLEGQLHKEVVEKKNLLLKLDDIVRTAKESQQREFSRRAMERLLLRAYEKYMAFCGPNVSSSKNINRAGRHAAVSFVKRALARCRNYDEVGTSCFDEPTFKDMFLSATSHRSSSDAASQDNNTTVKSVHRASASDASRASSHLTGLSFVKEDPWTNNVKQRELLLDEVVGSITGGTMKISGLGTSLVSNTKGKRSERDREGKGHNREGARSGRPPSSNAKGERKNKTKPKQKTANISAPSNSTPRDPQLPATIMPSGNGKDSTAAPAAARRDDPANTSNDAEMPDLSNLELPGMDVDFGGWLNMDDDGLQDLDLMGLEIPMDDINEINLMI